jgi:16S rRNA (guanine1516-N2)-methyltransferase
MTTNLIAVCADESQLHAIAEQCADNLHIPLVAPNDTAHALLLAVTPHDGAPGYRLELRQTGENAPGPVYVDFVGGKAGHRRRSGEGRKQPLARAAGLKHGANPSVVDATGGLGRDAFVLATLGCDVRVIERSPVIAALLDDGLTRARADAATAPIAARLQLIRADARDYLAVLADAERPDVIYLDPMYPHRTKSALVKKEMRVFRALIGDDEDAPALLAVALLRARKRVVVKRPRAAAVLRGPLPGFEITSPNTRLDVYPVAAAQNAERST